MRVFLFLSVTVGSSTLYAAKRRNALKNELSNDYYVPVSVIVPAYNEEVTIEATIRSLLALDYRLYEIIVVDDGSSDRTSETVQHAFGMRRIDRPIQQRIACQPQEAVYETRSWKVPITLVRKKNGGKADALNMGINVSSYPYFLCIDADSVLQRDSLGQNRAACPRERQCYRRWRLRASLQRGGNRTGHGHPLPDAE